MIDLDEIAHRLSMPGSKQRAADQKRYLKSDLDFFGVSVPEVRGAIKYAYRANRDIDRSELLRASEGCFETTYFEMQLFGVLLLERYMPLLQQGDLRHIERLVRKCSTWALVDPLSKPGTYLVDMDMAIAGPILDRWSVDENFWLRRMSLLVLMTGLRRDDEYWDRFVGYADSMIEEREFFVRKAIGWVLRDLSKLRPEPVAGFVRRHMGVISGVTFREAVKYLPEPAQGELRAAYKAR